MAVEPRRAGQAARPGQSLRSSTRRTEWSAAFCSTSRARERVGAMLTRRFGPLTAAQMPSAVVARLLVGQVGEPVEVGRRCRRTPSGAAPGSARRTSCWMSASAAST